MTLIGAAGWAVRAAARGTVRRAGSKAIARGALEAPAASAVGRWLVIALLIDLVVTRFALRLAIFIPKEEPIAGVVGPGARIGAVAENVVALVTLLVLVLLLVGARRTSSTSSRVGLIASAGVAAGGLSLLLWPPAPAFTLALHLLTGGAALLLTTAAVRARDGGSTRIAIALLGGSLVATSFARALEAFAALSGDLVPAEPVLVVGQVAYVAGAFAVGLAGLQARSSAAGSDRRWLVVGIAVGIVALFLGLRSPVTSGMLLTWSLGLSGGVPLPVVAVIAGIAVAGLGRLWRRDRSRALGAAILLLAGAGPATSALVLASLVGLRLFGLADSPETQGRPAGLGGGDRARERANRRTDHHLHSRCGIRPAR